MVAQNNEICNKLFKDIMELKRMMEKLGQAKTHLELKKMIAEVDTTNSGTDSIVFRLIFAMTSRSVPHLYGGKIILSNV